MTEREEMYNDYAKQLDESKRNRVESMLGLVRSYGNLREKVGEYAEKGWETAMDEAEAQANMVLARIEEALNG